MARRPTPPCLGEGLAVRRVVLRCEDVVFFKGILEALDGLAHVFAERGGDLTVATTDSRAAELDAVLCDLKSEIVMLEPT